VKQIAGRSVLGRGGTTASLLGVVDKEERRKRKVHMVLELISFCSLILSSNLNLKSRVLRGGIPCSILTTPEFPDPSPHHPRTCIFPELSSL
jgi:hypothetical protein